MSHVSGRRRRLVVEEDINGVTIVNFVDNKILDEANIQQLGEELFSLVNGPRKMLLNFSNVEDLKKVPGLDAKKVEAAKDRLVF